MIHNELVIFMMLVNVCDDTIPRCLCHVTETPHNEVGREAKKKTKNKPLITLFYIVLVH